VADNLSTPKSWWGEFEIIIAFKPPSCPFFLQLSLDTLISLPLYPLFPFIMSMEVDTPLSFQPGTQSAATYAIFSNPLKVKY